MRGRVRATRPKREDIDVKVSEREDILAVTIPKAQAAKPGRIEIET